LAGGLEPAGQLAQAGVGLKFQGSLGLAVALEGGADFGEQVGGEGEDLRFALLAEGEGWGAVGLALSAVAGGLAATAAQGDEGAAQEERPGG
jgi:hypothetical protein